MKIDLFDIPGLIAFVCRGITLTPGDIIFTSTPPSVGAFRKSPMFLQVGDEVTVEVKQLGRLTNRVVAER